MTDDLALAGPYEIFQLLKSIASYLTPSRERHGSPVVRTRPARVQSPGWEARIISVKPGSLYIGDCESLVTG